MNAVMSGPAATTPNQLLDWTCTQYDQTYALSGYATVSRTNSVNASNKWTSSLHSFGRTDSLLSVSTCWRVTLKGCTRPSSTPKKYNVPLSLSFPFLADRIPRVFLLLHDRQALGERLVDGEVDNVASRNHHPPADQIVGLENGADQVMTSANSAATTKRANFETSNLGHVAREKNC